MGCLGLTCSRLTSSRFTYSMLTSSRFTCGRLTSSRLSQVGHPPGHLAVRPRRSPPSLLPPESLVLPTLPTQCHRSKVWHETPMRHPMHELIARLLHGPSEHLPSPRWRAISFPPSESGPERVEEVGTQKSNISRLESGAYNPSLDMLIKIAHSLGREVQVTLKPMGTAGK